MSGRECDGLPTERVAERVRGTDPCWRSATIAEGFASFSDQIREIGLGYESVRQRRVCSSAFESTFGRSNASAVSNSNALGAR